MFRNSLSVLHYTVLPASARVCLRRSKNYMAKICGPLLDRIDLHIEVSAVKFMELSRTELGEPSKKIRERVVRARETNHREHRDRC